MFVHRDEVNDGEYGFRIECPAVDCHWQLIESEWQHKNETDHKCPNNHWFRVVGDDEESLVEGGFYLIDEKDIEFENML